MEGRSEEPDSGGVLLGGLGELVDWVPMAGSEDASSGSGLAEGEQDKKESAELRGPPGSDSGQSGGIWG